MKRLAPLFLFSTLSLAAASETKAPVPCLATREFITTLEYLCEHKEFSLPETDAQAFAHKISAGCTGASKRFIRTNNVLVKAGVPTRRSMEVAAGFGRRRPRSSPSSRAPTSRTSSIWTFPRRSPSPSS